jgi:hypothetical protein
MGASAAARELMVEGAVEKPFDPDDLVREIERILLSQGRSPPGYGAQRASLN